VLVLGVDPGTRFLGWGAVEQDGMRVKHLGHGVIKLPADRPLAERLLGIEQALGRVIARYQPDVGSVETLFFHKDAQAAAKLGHARGVVLLSFARADVPVAEYSPARVKATVVGHGQAGKQQVARMIQVVLRLDSAPPSDAADALALAVTHGRAPLHGLRPRGTVANPYLAEVLARAAGGRRAQKSTLRSSTLPLRRSP
jgi:crossover junction endodeoxyribonuclease RuvC